MNTMDVLRTQIETALTDLGHNALEAKNEIQHFLASIEEIAVPAAANSDERTLKYVRSQVAARLGRVSLKLLYRERTQILTVVMTALRVLALLGAAA